MTNKEAIEELKKVDTLDMPARLCEAHYMSIKALKQEPCDDCISRQAVHYYIESHINAIITESGVDKNEHTNRMLRALVNGVDTMPSVTPTEMKSYIDNCGNIFTYPTERTGHWIGNIKVGFGEWQEYIVPIENGFVTDDCHCCECGEELEKGERGVFCPNCGARMFEPQESEEV